MRLLFETFIRFPSVILCVSTQSPENTIFLKMKVPMAKMLGQWDFGFSLSSSDVSTLTESRATKKQNESRLGLRRAG